MILIIDDDIAVRTSLSLLLRKEGFETSAVDTPAGALDMIDAELPELVIMDMNFSNETSGNDGLQLLERIKSTNPNLPVMLITGWATIDLAVKGIAGQRLADLA